MTDWTDIAHTLRAKNPAPPAPGSAEAFWLDFKARARLTPQIEPAPAPRRAWPVFAWAASAAALLAIILPLVWTPAALGGARVESLDVPAPHASAWILTLPTENSREPAALIWVSGLEEDSP